MEMGKEVLLQLTVQDYSKGPEPDHDQSGEIWVFGKKIDNLEIYIKLKIAEIDGGKIAKCIAIHPAKYPLRYPFK